MEFTLERSLEILTATPAALRAMLTPLSADWTLDGGSRDNWPPYDVVAHLIYAEQEDWMPRVRVILSEGSGHEFPPFDQHGHFSRPDSPSLVELLNEFAAIRTENLAALNELGLDDELLSLTALHPKFGEVTLRQLLATWTVHDLNHIRQIVVFMAKRYEDAVGPWKEFLKILH